MQESIPEPAPNANSLLRFKETENLRKSAKNAPTFSMRLFELVSGHLDKWSDMLD
jgi:hypothetical protein